MAKRARMATLVGMGGRPLDARGRADGGSRFHEVVRRMMEHASGYRPARREGRWIIATKHQGQDWEIVVQPDTDAKTLGVVTAYAVTREDP